MMGSATSTGSCGTYETRRPRKLRTSCSDRCQSLLATDLDAPRDDARARACVSEQREREGRLAATGLADDAENPALAEFQRDVLDDRRSLKRFDTQPVHDEQLLVRAHRRASSFASIAARAHVRPRQR